MNTNTSIDTHNLVSSEEATMIIKSSAQTLISNPEMASSLPAHVQRRPGRRQEHHREERG